MARYEYSVQSRRGEAVRLDAGWLPPLDDSERPMLRVMISVDGGSAYYIDLPEDETTKLAQTLAEGAF